MGAAISLLVILTLASVVIRIASVTLRLTGLPDHVARFQARSAFTGAGFTTTESESVVNYPIRRRIIGLLMTLGNVGLVTVLATLTVSFVSTEAAAGAMTRQFLWLLGTVFLLWVVALNPGCRAQSDRRPNNVPDNRMVAAPHHEARTVGSDKTLAADTRLQHNRAWRPRRQ